MTAAAPTLLAFKSIPSAFRQNSRKERSALCSWWSLPPHYLAGFRAGERRAITANVREFVSLGDFDRDISVVTEAGAELKIAPRLRGLEISITYHHHPWVAPGGETAPVLAQSHAPWSTILDPAMSRHEQLTWASGRPQSASTAPNRFAMIMSDHLHLLTPRAQITVRRPNLQGMHVRIDPLHPGTPTARLYFPDQFKMHEKIVEQARAADAGLRRLPKWKSLLLDVAVVGWNYRSVLWDDSLRALSQLRREYFNRSR